MDRMNTIKLEQYLKEHFYNNKMRWPNNKRRFHSLPLLRKPLNKKNRSQPNPTELFELFNLIDYTLTLNLEETIQEQLNNFCELKEISL